MFFYFRKFGLAIKIVKFEIRGITNNSIVFTPPVVKNIITQMKIDVSIYFYDAQCDAFLIDVLIDAFQTERWPRSV